MTSGLAGRVVVVTGATGSAGSATTAALRAAGATVVAVGQSPERLSALAEAIPGIAVEVADLSERSAVDQLAARVREQHGAVDGIMHLVGGYRGGAGFAANTDEDWRFLSSGLIDTLRHVTSPFTTTWSGPRRAGRSSCRRRRPQHRQLVPRTTRPPRPLLRPGCSRWPTLCAASSPAARRTPLPQTSAATILVIKALVDARMRAAAPERKLPGFHRRRGSGARASSGYGRLTPRALNGARIALS